MRRILAVASATTLTLGLTVGVAPTASAADLGTVTVDYVSSGGSGTWTVTPSSLMGSVGDTFVLINQRDSGNNAPSVFVSLQNDSGAVSLGATSCTGTTTCPVLDIHFPSPRNSATFTINSTGTIKVMRSNAGLTQIGTLTISASGSGGGSSESVSAPQVTMTFDGNGGDCSSDPIEISGAGGATYQLPSEGSGPDKCSRENYTLLGWSHQRNATQVEPNLGAGATVNFANAGGTMFAVWRPLGVEVVYDANVGAADQCIRGGSNVVGDARQSAPVVLQEGRDGGVAATQAPCKPVDVQLVGWALTGDGPSVVAPGGGLPASFTRGSSYVLYAKWQVVFGLTFSAESLSMAPGQQATVTITATFNGAPAANAIVGLEVPPAGPFGLGSTLPLAVTDAAGQAVVTVVSSPNLTAASPPTTLTAAYGNTTASVQLTPAVERRIVIAGKRSSLSSITVIRISGKTTGFAAGDRVVPYIRFLGQTDYFEDSTRPEVSADGSFDWRSEFYGRREAGQDLNVYFTSEDGSIRSNALNFLPAR